YHTKDVYIYSRRQYNNGAYTYHCVGLPYTFDVKLRRNGTANTPLKLFFGGILGMQTIDLQAKARATIYSGSVSSLQVIPGVDAHTLPVALDYKIWNQLYATGQSPDGTIHIILYNGSPDMQVHAPTPHTLASVC